MEPRLVIVYGDVVVVVVCGSTRLCCPIVVRLDVVVRHSSYESSLSAVRVKCSS